MRIWDRIVEGMNGLGIAELLGLSSPPADDGGHPGLRQIGFTIGVIALGAKMARVDGEVSEVERAAFRDFFEVPPGEEANVERFFDLAKRDAGGFETYARQVAALFPDAPEILENVIEDCSASRRPTAGSMSPKRTISRRSPASSACPARGSSARRPLPWGPWSASPASCWASIRWRPTSRSARPGCGRCAPTIPTG